MSSIVYSKTAPRLLQDIIEYDAEASYYNLFSIESQNGRCKHVFHENSHRFAGPSLEGEVPGQNTKWTVASTCEHCRLHVDVAIQYTPGGGSCVLAFNDAAPLHHFCFDPTDNEFKDELPREYRLRCSYEHCRARVMVSFRQPVIRDEEVKFLTTTARARSREQGVYKEPVVVLKGYTKQVLEGRAQRIPMKNQRFRLALGIEASDLLRRLGASYDKGNAADGEDDGWLPAQLGDHDTRQLQFDRQRRIVEDADQELAFLIATATSNSFAPPPSYRSLEHILGCLKYNKATTSRRAEQGADASLQMQAYKCLGALSNFSDDLIAWSFDKQATTDSPQRALYFDAIKNIASDRSAEALDVKVATLQSQGFATMNELEAAYQTLGINPRHVSHINDQMILSSYHGRYPDSGPAQQVEMRKAMQLLATYRGSQELQDVVKDTIETYHEALQWLGVDRSTDAEFVWAAKVTKDHEDHNSVDMNTRAIEIIQRETDSVLLASHLREQGTKMSKGDALMTLGLPHLVGEKLTAQAANDILSAAFKFADSPADKKGEVSKALECINESLNDPTISETAQTFRNQAVQPATYTSLDIPRGLRNRGNTCYLAALLQLIFTIAPVRQLTDNVRSDPSAALTDRRLEKPYSLAVKLAEQFRTFVTSREAAVTLDTELAAAFFESDPESSKELEIEKRRRSTVGATGRPSIKSPPLEPMNEEPEGLPQVQSPTEDVSMFGSAQPTNGEAINTPGTTDEPMTMESQQDQPMTDAVADEPATEETLLKKVALWERQSDMREVLHTTYNKLDKASKLSPILKTSPELRDFNRFIQMQDTTHSSKADGNETARIRDQIKFLHVRTDYHTTDFHSLIEKIWGFDRDEVSGSEKVHTFTDLPPILHIEVSSGADYDPVNKLQPELRLDYVPEQLSMDRYKDDKNLLERRRKFAENLGMLDVLYKARKVMEQPGVQMKDGGELLTSVYGYLEQIKDVPGISDVIEDDFVLALKQLADSFPAELQHVNDSIRNLEHEQAQMFPEDKQPIYRLHAVVNHHGSSNVSGHYTVYIYDAASDTWYFYNDERVELMSSKDEILDPSKHSDSMGKMSPALLVYVRIDQADQLVQTVCRQPDPEPELPQGQQPQAQVPPPAGRDRTMKDTEEKSSACTIHGMPIRGRSSTGPRDVPQFEHGLPSPEESSDEEGTYALTRQPSRHARAWTPDELHSMQFGTDLEREAASAGDTEPWVVVDPIVMEMLCAPDIGKRKRDKYSEGR